MKMLSWLTTARRFSLFVLAFSLFGLVLIFDASVAESLATFQHPWHYIQNQAVWFALGTVIFFCVQYIPLIWWKTLAPLFFGVSLVLLVLVLIPGLGEKYSGAQRWLVLGPVRLQPAELAKLSVIIFFASWLEKHQRFAPFAFFTGVIFTLVMLQPNLSTAFILVALATSLFFFAGGNIKPILIFGSLGAVLVAILIFSAPYRRERLRTFLNPEADPLGRSYHIRQITLALGRGGMWGQGIGLSKQKQHYLPETSTDSIFAIFAEEAGFVGALVLLAAYGTIIASGYALAQQQSDPFSFLVASGVTTWIALHVLLNISAMVALIPLTGVPLPLLSYGGSSFVTFMIGLGLLGRLFRQGGEKSDSKPRKLRSRPLVRYSGK